MHGLSRGNDPTVDTVPIVSPNVYKFCLSSRIQVPGKFPSWMDLLIKKLLRPAVMEPAHGQGGGGTTYTNHFLSNREEENKQGTFLTEKECTIHAAERCWYRAHSVKPPKYTSNKLSTTTAFGKGKTAM